MASRVLEEIHEQVNALLDLVRPVAQADLRRREAFDVVKDVLARAIPECQCFLMGSFPLRTYLPDSDIDIAVLVPDSPTTQSDTQTTLRKILDALYCAAMQPEPQEAGHTLRNISFVNAKTPVVRCTVGNVDFDVTVNQIGSLGAITFLEEADRFIGKQHLFKRSLLLLKLWLSTEAVTYAGRPLLGAKNGMFSSYAVSVMVLYLFNAKRDDSLNHPFEVLRAFLETYSRFPWDSCVLTLQGAAPIQIGKTVAKPVDMPASVENRFRPLLERFQNMQPEPLPERDDVSRPPPGSQFRLRVCNIQDPLNADNNLTPTVTKSTLLVIKSGLQNAYTHLHHVCMSLGVTIPVPPAPFAPQAATTAPQLVMLPARPASAAAAHSHVPPHHPSSAAFARGIAMPFVMHGANGQAQQLQQLQQQQQQQQQAALSGQVQPPMLPIGASQPSLQATAAANTSSAVPPISYRRTSSESPEPPLQRSKYSTSHEALQRCWALRSFFPHSFQLYIISGPKRPDLLDHPFQALQVTPPVRPRGSFDWSHLEPAKLEGDIESMWFALIQASRIASEWGSGASQIVSPREGINMLTSSPTSAAHFSPTLWQNQSGPALRAVDLFDLDGTSTCSGHSPLTSSSDVAVQSSGATDAEDTEDIEDAEDHRAPEPPRTEDKCTQTAAIAEDVLLRLPAEETATATATTTATARTPSPPPPPIREPAPGPPALVDPSPKPKKRRNNKRSKSPGRTASLSELQHNGTTVNAKAEAVEHITAAHCAIASPAAVQGVHLPSASSAFQSHLFTMVWSCMVCILLMHFRLLEFSSQPPAGAQNECTAPAVPPSTSAAVPSCGECVCPQQVALPHWLRLNGSLSLGDVAAEPGLSYQWVKDGTQIPGATSPFYNIQNATWQDAGVYERIVRNTTALTSRVSRTVLHVGQPPRVKPRMIMQSLAVGQTLALHIEAEGLPTPQFQWRRNGIPIAGATSNIFVVPSVNLAHAGTYTCEISNIAGRVLWEEATIAVEN